MSDILQLSSFPYYPFFSLLSFVWGACIGSFLNVCVFRIPREISVINPRSFCPHCSKTIPWHHNIPLVSFLVLRAKCKYCGGRISIRYFLVELLTAIFFLLTWLKFGLEPGPRFFGLVPITDWRLIPIFWLVVSGLILGTFVDFEHLIIPDRVTLGGIVAGLIFSALVPTLHGHTDRILALLLSTLGAAMGGALLWTMAVLGKIMFRKDAMGMGDIKLVAAIGAFFGTKAVLFTIFVSSLIGSVVGITLVLSRRKSMQSKIPYGPYLALAAVIWMLWGPNLWNVYLDLVTHKTVCMP